MSDVLLDNIEELTIRGGDFVTEDSRLQEVGIILRLNQGDLKSDPLLGPNLIQMEKGLEVTTAFKERVRIHLARDGKDYNEIKTLINIRHKTQ